MLKEWILFRALAKINRIILPGRSRCLSIIILALVVAHALQPTINKSVTEASYSMK